MLILDNLLRLCKQSDFIDVGFVFIVDSAVSVVRVLFDVVDLCALPDFLDLVVSSSFDGLLGLLCPVYLFVVAWSYRVAASFVDQQPFNQCMMVIKILVNFL